MTDAPSLSTACRRDTKRVARALAKVIRPSDLVVLDGQLGSGKTFLVRALSRALGLPERIRVTSPTFSLVHEIATQPRILHADLYRLTTRRDIESLGLLERRDEGDVIIAEWGRPFIDALGGDALLLEFSHAPRRIVLQHTGPRSHELATQLFADLGQPDPTR